jgi:hypothetical protein
VCRVGACGFEGICRVVYLLVRSTPRVVSTLLSFPYDSSQ